MDSHTQRKSQRERLLADRSAAADRAEREQALRAQVGRWLAHAGCRALGFYWPIRGEPDLREVVGDWLRADAGRIAALPVISGDTLVFHAWTPEALMRAAEFGIPVPAHGRPVQPDCLLIPCVGFDARRYRLGYGGGYYDRTLAKLVPWPLTVGIAFESGRIDTLEPHAHDMQLDVVITDAAIDS